MPSISREFFTLSDGVRMAIYHRPGEGVPIFCIPGLTRNHRDFLPLLDTFSERPFYLCDLRGRGASDRDQIQRIIVLKPTQPISQPGSMLNHKCRWIGWAPVWAVS